MGNDIRTVIGEVVGLDLGDRRSHLCMLDRESGAVLEEGTVLTTREGLERRFSTARPLRIALEAGTHSPWVSQLLEGLGHEVIVAALVKNIVSGHGVSSVSKRASNMRLRSVRALARFVAGRRQRLVSSLLMVMASLALARSWDWK